LHRSNFFFVPKDFDLLSEYEQGIRISEISPLYSTGFATHRDRFVTDFSFTTLNERINMFCDPKLTDDEVRTLFGLKDTRDWKLSFARKSLQEKIDLARFFTQCLYRPFDKRQIFYTSDVVEYPRLQVMEHLQNKNLGIVASRIIKGEEPAHFCVTRYPTEKIFLSPKTSNNAFVFPLYLYPTDDDAKQKSLLDVSPWPGDDGEGDRVPNLTPEFVADLEKRLNLSFVPKANISDLQTTFDAEDIFHYIYAIFHSPTYRSRYAEFLKIDFPRVPLTSDVDLFRALCGLGQELVGLHLLESPAVGQFITSYPVAGDNRVEKGYPKYTPPTAQQPGRVHINGLTNTLCRCIPILS